MYPIDSTDNPYNRWLVASNLLVDTPKMFFFMLFQVVLGVDQTLADLHDESGGYSQHSLFFIFHMLWCFVRWFPDYSLNYRYFAHAVLASVSHRLPERQARQFSQCSNSFFCRTIDANMWEIRILKFHQIQHFRSSSEMEELIKSLNNYYEVRFSDFVYGHLFPTYIFRLIYTFEIKKRLLSTNHPLRGGYLLHLLSMVWIYRHALKNIKYIYTNKPNYGVITVIVFLKFNMCARGKTLLRRNAKMLLFSTYF